MSKDGKGIGPGHKRLRGRGGLLARLNHPDLEVRRQVAEEIGRWAEEVFPRDPEGVREVMRRLMWSLTEESGGIGWGAPLAMAEMALRVRELAEDFAPIILSYIRPEGNALEFKPLFLEALEAVSRLAEGRPEVLEALGAEEVLERLLSEPEAVEMATRALRKMKGR